MLHDVGVFRFLFVDSDKNELIVFIFYCILCAFYVVFAHKIQRLLLGNTDGIAYNDGYVPCACIATQIGAPHEQQSRP